MFDVERNVVRNELRQRYSDSASRLYEPLYAGMFPSEHPYHHLPIGTEQSLEGLTLDAARAYASRWYTPPNTTLHVSGDTTGEALMDVVARTFPKDLLVDPGSGNVLEAQPSFVAKKSSGCRGSGRPAALELPEVDPPALQSHRGAVRSPVGMIGWVFPPEASILARFDLWIAELAMEAELELPVSCSVNVERHAGTAFCSVSLPNGADAEKTLKKAIRAASDRWEPNVRGYLGQNYANWQRWERAELYRELDRTGSEVVALHFHENGRQDWIEAWLETMSVDDFGEAAAFGQRWLPAKRAHLAVLQPSDDEPAALPSFHGDRADRSFTELQPSAVDEAFLDRIVGEPRWAAAQQRTLPNGLVVTVLPQGRTDVVRAELSFPGASVAEPTPGLDMVTWEMLPDVTYAESMQALAVLGSLYGVRRDDHWAYRVDGVDLDAQLGLLRSHIGGQQPQGVPKDVVDRIARYRATAIGKEAFAREAALSGGLAPTAAKLMASVGGLKGKDLNTWAKTQLGPGGAHLLIVGNVQPTLAHSLAKAHFGDLKAGPARPAPAAREVATPTPALLVVEDDRARTQASVRLACRLDTDDPIAASVVGSLVVTASEDALRRSKGLTYGVHGGAARDVGGRRLDVVTQVQREGIADAVKALREVVGTLSASGPDEASLAAARLDQAGRMADQLQSSRDILAFMGAELRAGVAPSAMGDVAKALMAVDGDDVRKALGPCVGHEVISVLGTDVPAVLTAAGLPHHVVP
ncbi:MAG: insulinase family protein [Myxococcota bacterium]